MTTPTPPLLTEAEEREVNEVLCRFMGEEWNYRDSFYEHRRFVWNSVENLSPFTRSLDTLRLAEEKLTPEQWWAYGNLLRTESVKLNFTTKPHPYMGGIICALKLPVSLRAAALVEVVE